MVEASRLLEPISTRPVGSGKGACGALWDDERVTLDFVDIFDKFVMDDLGQLQAGPFGALRPHINPEDLRGELHGEIGETPAAPNPASSRRDPFGTVACRPATSRWPQRC